MNKQEQIEKMAEEGRDELIAGNYQGKTDIERLCRALHRAGYIKGADFVSKVAWKLANKIEWENHGRTFYLEEINQILDEVLQEYLKGE